MGAEFKKVFPKPGLIVRDSRTKAILPETGTNVPWIGPEGRYWRRRLRDGSITLEPEAKQEKTVKEEKKIFGGKK